MYGDQTIQQILKNKTIAIDQLDAELLIMHILKKPREFVLAHPEYNIKWLKQRRIKKLFKKRANNIPLAYLTGHKEFFGLDFLVNKHTLIPRPETEMLVDLGLQEIQKLMTKDCKLTMIDVGTGSGCIPISIMKHRINNELQIISYASDISFGALKIAKKNANLNHVNIIFKHGNLLIPFQSLISNIKSPLLITANLPYLTEEQYHTSPTPEIHKEPKSALVSNDNGLSLYEELLKQIKNLATDYKLHFILLMEIDPSQSQLLTKKIKQIFSRVQVKIKKDYMGNERVIYVHYCHDTFVC